MKWALTRDYEIFLAGERAGAMEAFRGKLPLIVCLDLGLPPDEGGVSQGLMILDDLLELDPCVKVIIITGRDEKEHALRAIERGAYDFFCKPVQIEELQVVLKRALHVSALERENRELQQFVSVDAYQGILGSSPQMQKIFEAIGKVATTEVPVLILGESGTGKEMVARAIHRMSSRRKHSFVAINCGAIPENLLESELFGHEKGSFTGAHALKKGRIESAQGGTLFLDEIGDLPLPLQVKLLRFLQEQQFLRVGGREEITVDVRVLAATNTDLDVTMKEGHFREDLYFRLGVVIISLPPLREREGDAVLLAKTFLDRYAAEMKKKMMRLTPQAIRAIDDHDWPGNIRELENRIKRAIIMAEGTKITPMDLQLATTEQTKLAGLSLKAAREALEKELIQRAFSRHKGNMTKVAAELGISRPTLYELMQKLRLEKE